MTNKRTDTNITVTVIALVISSLLLFLSGCMYILAFPSVGFLLAIISGGCMGFAVGKIIHFRW